MKHVALIGLAALTLSCGVQAQPIVGEELIPLTDKQTRQLQALTPEYVAEKVDITDDSLEPIATLTTGDAWTTKGSFKDKVRSDNFLRAFVVKQTGEVRYQIYQQVTYSGEWRRFASVNYLTTDGPASAKVDAIARKVVTCDYGLCVYREVIGFNLSRSVLENIADQYVPGASPFWRFRFKAQNGLDWEDRITPAEASGLLRAVDTYLAKLDGS